MKTVERQYALPRQSYADNECPPHCGKLKVRCDCPLDHWVCLYHGASRYWAHEHCQDYGVEAWTKANAADVQERYLKHKWIGCGANRPHQVFIVYDHEELLSEVEELLDGYVKRS